MLSPTIALLDVELPRYLDEHKMIISSLSWGLMLKTIIPAGVGSALHMMMHGKDPALASTLFKGLASGLELRADDAIYAVRERYIHQPRALHHVGVVERCAAIVRCWQTMRSGRPMPQGKWAGTSSMFPSIE